MATHAAIVENGVVVNIALAEPDFAAEQGWIVSDTAKIGDLWDGQTFTSAAAPAPDIDAQWAIIRAERNRLLVASDWTQLPDAPADAAAWATYRQALRDVTTQANPFAIVWPESPSS